MTDTKPCTCGCGAAVVRQPTDAGRRWSRRLYATDRCKLRARYRRQEAAREAREAEDAMETLDAPDGRFLDALWAAYPHGAVGEMRRRG